MPRASVQTQNIAPVDQAQQSIRGADAIRSPQQPELAEPKLITAPEEPEQKPLLIEDNHEDNITRDVTQQHITAPTLIKEEEIPAPEQLAVPTNLSAPEVRDSVQEWEQTQGAVSGADVQAQLQTDTSNRLMCALPAHVLSPTPKKPKSNSFDEQEHHLGLKDKITDMAEGLKDRAENMWEGAKHRGEDLREKAAGVMHDTFQDNRAIPKGMISDDEAVRIGKKFDVTDRSEGLGQEGHNLLGGVKSFFGHKWHELTHAPASEYRDELPPARETEEWDVERQEFEHMDDAQLRAALQSRQLFESRSFLPRSPLENQPFIGFAAQDRMVGERQRPISPVMVRDRFIERSHPAEHRILDDGRRVEVMRGHEIYLPDGYDIVHRAPLRDDPLHRHLVADEARERSRMHHDHDRQPSGYNRGGLFSGISNFVHDKWDGMFPSAAAFELPTREVRDVPQSRVRNGSPVRNFEVRPATAFQGGPVRHVLEQDFPNDTRAFTDDQGVPRELHRRGIVHNDDHLRYNFNKAKETVKEDLRFLVSPLKQHEHDRFWHTTFDRFGNKRTAIAVPPGQEQDRVVHHHREPLWARAEHRFEHLIGADRRVPIDGPDVVQKMQAMDQENILERETDLPFAAGRGFTTEADVRDFGLRRDVAYPSPMGNNYTTANFWDRPLAAAPQHYGSLSSERLGVVRDRMGDGFDGAAHPIIKTGRVTLLTEQDSKKNIDLHPAGTWSYPQQEFVSDRDRILREQEADIKQARSDIRRRRDASLEQRDRIIERGVPRVTEQHEPAEHRGWFANFRRHKSPEKIVAHRNVSPIARRAEEYDMEVVEDIVAGAPVQRTALQHPEGLHQARAGMEIPILARDDRPPVKNIRREEDIVVHGDNGEHRGVLANVRNFLGHSWGRLTGAASTPVEKAKSGLEKFEDNLAEKVERYEARQFREAKEDWLEGKFSQAHSHASRGHAAENIAEHLRGTTKENKENITTPTTPITPGYPV